jgi:hypothetical protein
LFSSKSSQEWDSNINAIIILDNEHRFKEDAKYGKMLKRMWEGDLTLEDKQRINSRVIGDNGLKLHPCYKVSIKSFKFRIICRL